MGASNIYQKLKAAIGNDYGVFGLMGNLMAESGLKANNLQNSYNKKLNISDEDYTMVVDENAYPDFVTDKAGYGLAQWTYWSRKQKLLQYAQAYGCSIGDENMQVDFMIGELMASYPSVLNVLKNATSIREASDCVLTQYERPADQSESVKAKRAAYGEDLMKQLLGGNTITEGKEEAIVGYTNSPLVSYTKLSPNHSGQRTHAIDRITPHCVVGQCSVETLGNIFAPTERQASCNYGIGVDGRVGMYCEEKNRSWCSSSSANDQRAITIECASDTTAPYAFKDIVYDKLIELCVDICKRNGKTKLLWLGDKDETLAYNPAADEMVLTVHRWFANKSCPGDWMYQRMGDLAAKVTAKLGGTATTEPEKTPGTTTNNFPAVPFTVNVKIDDLNYRSQPSMEGTVKGQTGKGVFTIVEVNNGWGKLKSGVGWIWLGNPQYCTINDTVKESTPTFSPYKVRVSIKDLNIRKGPGTNYVSNGFCPVGVYTIIEESDGAGATKWGKLKSGAGWVSLDYAKRV